MYRNIQTDLKRWKNKSHRKPLLIRGARQVGKSYSIEQFGQTEFQSLAIVNFEKEAELIEIFNATLDPRIIVDAISKYLSVNITAGETLLFLDEIQICPRALLALRYFKEEMPELHVIAAGSLLEFAIKAADFSMPVGRIESLYMKPLSFEEYLMASGREALLEECRQATLLNPINIFTHNVLIEELKIYYELGGMPEVISYYLKNKSIYGSQEIQASIIEVYRNDFGKYNTNVKHEHVDAIFRKSPYIIGEKFKYLKINPNVQTRELKPALQTLVDAGLIYFIYHTSASSLPFGATRNDRIFKLLFLDEGLVRYVVNAGTTISKPHEWPAQNQGPLSEQFVGQELLANAEKYRPAELYFWDREKKGSTAEVDYVVNVGSDIYPIEVKSGKTGRLKSLQQFITEKNSKFGIRISEKPLTFESTILSIPLYMISEIPRLIENLNE